MSQMVKVLMQEGKQTGEMEQWPGTPWQADSQRFRMEPSFLLSGYESSFSGKAEVKAGPLGGWVERLGAGDCVTDRMGRRA